MASGSGMICVSPHEPKGAISFFGSTLDLVTCKLCRYYVDAKTLCECCALKLETVDEAVIARLVFRHLDGLQDICHYICHC